MFHEYLNWDKLCKIMVFNNFAVLLVFSLLSLSLSWLLPKDYKRIGKSSVFNLKSVTIPGCVNHEANLPVELVSYSTINDMVLVERISAPDRTAGGLFLPKIEGKDQKHLGIVLSTPKSLSQESNYAHSDPIVPYEVGDIVFIRVRNFFQ